MTERIETFDFFAVDADQLPPVPQISSLALAYIGDAVWEMIVRRHLLVTGEIRPNRLHKTAIRFVRAGTQAELVRFITEHLSEEELLVFKRGRNAKSGHTPKSSDVAEYRQSTGFEAVFGYLYVTAQFARIQELGILCINQLGRMDLK